MNYVWSVQFLLHLIVNKLNVFSSFFQLYLSLSCTIFSWTFVECCTIAYNRRIMTNQSTENRIVQSSKSNIYFIDQRKLVSIFFFSFSSRFSVELSTFVVFIVVRIFFPLVFIYKDFFRSVDEKLCKYSPFIWVMFRMLWFISGDRCTVLWLPIKVNGEKEK